MWALCSAGALSARNQQIVKRNLLKAGNMELIPPTPFSWKEKGEKNTCIPPLFKRGGKGVSSIFCEAAASCGELYP